MASGVPVDDKCLEYFQDLKLKQRYQYIIYKINENNVIVVDSVMEPSSSHHNVDDEKAAYNHFVNSLPSDDCRYAVYDFEYQLSAAEGKRKKICFFVWAPDTARIKQKMIYASSKDALRKKLVGVASEIQGTDYSEVDYMAVLDRIKAI